MQSLGLSIVIILVFLYFVVGQEVTYRRRRSYLASVAKRYAERAARAQALVIPTVYATWKTPLPRRRLNRLLGGALVLVAALGVGILAGLFKTTLRLHPMETIAVMIGALSVGALLRKWSLRASAGRRN